MPDNVASQSPLAPAIGYEIVPIRVDHASSLADAHFICFPGYFLTSLGRPYVRLFYHAMASSRLGLAVIAQGEDGRVLSFAAGATKSDDFRRYFFRHYLVQSAWALLRGFLADRNVRRYVLTQGYRVTDALKLLVKRDRPRSSSPKAPPDAVDPTIASLKAYSLMSLGTLPECRGGRLASEIILAFERAVLERGGNAVKVSTGKENLRAIGFYVKNGYRVYRDTRPGDVDLIKELPRPA